MATEAKVTAFPKTEELVALEVLRVVGLNAQAFSGTMNPSTIYRQMVQGSPSVFPYYRELEEKDTAVASALQRRRRLVLSRDAEVRSANDKDARATELQQGAAGFLQYIPKWRRCVMELLDAPAYGFSCAELMWQIHSSSGNGGTIGLREIIGRPQELFTFNRLMDPQTGPLRLAKFPGGEGELVPLAKFVVHTYGGRHGDRRGLPLLRRLFWPSWFKRNALRLHLQFLEKGPGTVAVQFANADDKAKALEAASAIVSDAAVAVPQGLTILESLLSTSRTRDANDFRQLFGYFDDEMTRLVLEQTQTTRVGEGGKGTQAIGRVHESTEDDVVRSDAEDLEETVNEQIIGPWLVWTYGPDALDRAVRPWWTIEKEPEQDAERELRVLAQVRNLGVDVPEREVYERSGVSEPEGDEAVLPPAALSIGISEDLRGALPPDGGGE